MSDELKSALEQMAERGHRAGPTSVAAAALADERLRRPSRGTRHSLISIAALVAATAVVAGLAIVRSQVPDIERVNVGSALSDGDDRARTLTVLVVGSDSRTGLVDPERRADAVMLLRANRETGAVSALSLPRDLYVPIAGTETPDRLARAPMARPTVLIETVSRLTGVAIDHYLEFDFTGFEKVVDAAGGVRLRIPQTMRDELAGLELEAGCQHLDGVTALAYVRARHLMIKDSADGRFRPEPTGDIGRMARQQQLFLVALAQLSQTRALNRIGTIADAVADNVRVDERFSRGDAVAFAKDLVQRRGPLALLTYPHKPATLPNGAAVLEPDDALVPGVLSVFKAPSSDHASGASSPDVGADCG